MSYAVKSIFNTIQGEGARAGTRAVFVRFAGCNLWSGRPEDRAKGKGACAKWCDTDFVGGDKLTLGELLSTMSMLWPKPEGRACVLTGGEPALQVDVELVDALHNAGWFVAMETNGTHETLATHAVDWLTLSPKIGGHVVLTHASELKVVLPGVVEGEGWSPADLVALGSAGHYPYKYVQPMDPLLSGAVEDTYLHPRSLSRRRTDEKIYSRDLKACLDFVQSNPTWRLGAQLHKIWNVP